MEISHVPKPEFHISVRDLVELMERSGDINFRFSSRSSAAEGIKGHQKLQQSRTGDYEAEKKVEGFVEKPDLTLRISGRVDGYYPDPDNFIVEEIKTVRIDVAHIPDSIKRLHWGQVKVYAHLLLREHMMPSEGKAQAPVAEPHDRVIVRLCYLDLEDNQEHQLDKEYRGHELQSFFDDLVDRYVTYLRQLLSWQRIRNQTIETLKFPFPQYRPGQREMAVSVYKTLKREGQLVMQAPTGIGKTIASIFPAVKALKELRYEKLFFLSAKTSGQAMAQSAIDDLKKTGLNLRDITLTAKEKICFNPGSPCDPEHCEYARGYYDKLPGVIDEVFRSDKSLRRETIEQIASEHTLCPFELSLDLSLLSDVVICDYNYVFDPVVYLRRFFHESNHGSNHESPAKKKAREKGKAGSSRYILLMDESHNLVDRGRDMFSAEFCKDDVLSLRRTIKDDLPLLAKKLGRINTEFLGITKPVKDQINQQGGAQLEECPLGLLGSLRRFCEVTEEWLQLNQPAYFQSELLEVYFSAIRLLRTAESAERGYAFLLLRRHNKTVFKIYCLNPGPGLSDGFLRLNTSVCFSATLRPQTYFKTLMGIEDSADWYQIESPFAAENLGVFTTTFISTTYKTRSDSLYELVDTLNTIISARSGNYLVYFPSYVYLGEVAEKFAERYPETGTIRQTPSMTEEERRDFLGMFESGRGPLLGFAVMGGVFGEAIDLKGGRLIGAIIVGVGLPQLGIERDLIRDYFNSDGFRHGSGFEFAYQYPGMNRVLQTAGRVIRSETDCGVVCLIDHRFNEASYQKLLPATWNPVRARNRQQLEQNLISFWRTTERTPGRSNASSS